MKVRWQNILLIAGLVGTFEFFMVNCGAAEHTGSYTSMESMRREAFKSKVQTYLVGRGCIGCHNDPTRVQFTSSNVEFAYQQAKTVVNFQYPEESYLYQNAFSGHCQRDLCKDKASADILLASIREWAALEQEDPLAEVDFVTSPMPVVVPSQLPIGTACTENKCVVRFNLGGMQELGAVKVPETLKDAVLELQMNQVTATTYQFSNPKVVGSTAELKLKGLHVFLRPCTEVKILGSEYKRGTGLAWNDIELQVPVVAKPATMPTGPLSGAALTTVKSDAKMITVPQGASCTGNHMAVGIEVIE